MCILCEMKSKGCMVIGIDGMFTADFLEKIAGVMRKHESAMREAMRHAKSVEDIQPTIDAVYAELHALEDEDAPPPGVEITHASTTTAQ